jgi:hypothetical protein
MLLTFAGRMPGILMAAARKRGASLMPHLAYVLFWHLGVALNTTAIPWMRQRGGET